MSIMNPSTQLLLLQEFLFAEALNQYIAQLGLALPFLNLPSILFFIDQKNMKIRLKLCAVSAVAMMIGSTAMLLMIRAGIGVGKDMIP